MLAKAAAREGLAANNSSLLKTMGKRASGQTSAVKVGMTRATSTVNSVGAGGSRDADRTGPEETDSGVAAEVTARQVS